MEKQATWIVLAEEQHQCPKHGDYRAQHVRLAGTPNTKMFAPHWTTCPTCDALLAQAQAAERMNSAQASQERDRQRLIAARIPTYHWAHDLASWQAKTPDMAAVRQRMAKYVEALPDALAAGRSVLLHGSPGTGKTHMACIVLREAVLRLGASGQYWTQAQVISRLRATMANGATETEEAVFRSLASLDLLVVDEIGRGSASDWERAQMFRAIDERYVAGRATLAVSNRTVEEVGQYLDAAGVDRLASRGGFALRMAWRSQRT